MRYHKATPKEIVVSHPPAAPISTTTQLPLLGYFCYNDFYYYYYYDKNQTMNEKKYKKRVTKTETKRYNYYGKGMTRIEWWKNTGKGWQKKQNRKKISNDNRERKLLPTIVTQIWKSQSNPALKQHSLIKHALKTPASIMIIWNYIDSSLLWCFYQS